MDTAIVTGASSGMGRDLCLQLSKRADAPKEIWAIARNLEKLNEVKQAASCPVRVVQADLTSQPDIDKVKALLATEKPKVDFLANVAGFARFGVYGQIPEKDVVGMIQVDLQAVVEMTYITIPYMPSGSSILEWGSVAAFQPLPGMNIYAACKAFVLSYSRALNNELQDKGISVTCVCPGWTKTPFLENAKKEGTGNGAVKSFWFAADPQHVVAKAIRDGLSHKAMSVYGLPSKIEWFFAKILPAPFVMAIWNTMRK